MHNFRFGDMLRVEYPHSDSFPVNARAGLYAVVRTHNADGPASLALVNPTVPLNGYDGDGNNVPGVRQGETVALPGITYQVGVAEGFALAFIKV